MQKTDNFFIKLVVVLVVSIFILVTVVYFMQNDWKLPNRINNWSFQKRSVIEEQVDDIQIEEEENNEEEMNAKRDTYAYRRYIESHVDICESEGFDLSCEETETKFSDETGCGCELTKEAIAEEEEIRKQMEELENGIDEDMLEEEVEEVELGYEHDVEVDPIVCTMEYAPVCGMLDGEYQTFGNDCMAEGSGIYDYTEGECEIIPVCGNGILEEGEQCDGAAMRTYPELVELFPEADLATCGCMPGLEYVYTCNNDCTQTCHCEE